MVYLPLRKQAQPNGAPVAWIWQPEEQRTFIILQMQDRTLVPCLVSFFEEDGDLLPFLLAWDEEEEEEFGYEYEEEEEEEEEDDFFDEDEDEDDFYEDEEDDFDDDLEDDDLDEDFDDVEVDVDEEEDEF